MKNLLLCILFSFSSWTFAQSELRFKENKTFKILQFTDIHWSQGSKNSPKTVQTMQEVIKKETPDFIVLTGDLVTGNKAKKGWMEMTKVLQNSKIPWTVTFGNHDEENNLTKIETYNILKKLPYFIGRNEKVSGVLNFELPVLSSKSNKTAAVLYFLDSHDYTSNPRLGKYDWIKSDQIDWYRGKSKFYTAQNGTQTPSMMFFHIPLLEYKFVAKDEATIGDQFEGVASPEINSGLFSAMIEQKDVMGVFTGHDHDNNYVGTYKDIALGFGNVTGADAYGKLERGGRVIILKENRFSFKSYISTPTQTKYDFNYPSGLTEIDEKTNVLPAINVTPEKQGLKYEYYEIKVESVNEIRNYEPKKRGVINSEINISNAEIEDHFAFIFSGYIKIPKTAYYKFYTYSDDGSVLKIDNKTIVDNDGGHAVRRREGVVALEKGFHKIELLYFEDYMGQKLQVGFSSIGIPEQEITGKYLYHKD